MNNTPNLNLKALKISTHAYERARERMKVKSLDQELNAIKSVLAQASYIGETTCENGHRSHMYVHNCNAVYISLDLETIKSIVPLDTHGHYEGLREKVRSLYYKEFRKTDRDERAKIKKLEYEKIKTDAEVAALRLRMYKTRSQNVKKECEEKIEALQNQVKEIESELKQIESRKRQIARAIATVV